MLKAKININDRPVKKPKVLDNFSFDENTYLKRDKMEKVFEAECKKCKSKVRGSIKVPSNFSKHLKTHVEQNEVIEDQSAQQTLSFNSHGTIKVTKNSNE
jgi:hypothetical protein